MNGRVTIKQAPLMGLRKKNHSPIVYDWAREQKNMSHIYYELYYHIVWGTKNRMELITNDIEELLKNLVDKKVNKLGGQQLEFNCVTDHCHSLLKIPPQISISDFTGQIKGYSAHEINLLRGNKYLAWQQGFGIVSLSKKGVPFVRKYIQNQKQHHMNNSIINILEYIPVD